MKLSIDEFYAGKTNPLLTVMHHSRCPLLGKVDDPSCFTLAFFGTHCHCPYFRERKEHGVTTALECNHSEQAEFMTKIED